jgi:hypothetical protein
MDKLAELLGYGPSFIYAAAAYGLFHWLDENASDEAKAALAKTMRLKDYKKEAVASALVEVFDRLYSYPLLHWRAFARSMLFTILVSSAYLFEANRFYGLHMGQHIVMWVQYLTVGLPFNIVTDYLSLFLIRASLKRSGNGPVLGLSLGALGGATIVWFANALRTLAVTIIYFGFSIFRSFQLPDVHNVWEMLWYIYEVAVYFLLAYPIFLWPAVTVFAWLPLFAIGILVARMLTALSWMVGRTQWFLKDGAEHPLKAIGYVAALIVFVAAALWQTVSGA